MKIKVTPEGLQDAWRFGKMSEADLKAADLLYNNELYSLAVFHLEQSIEKIVKSFLLSFGIKKTIGEIKRFQHRLPEMYGAFLEISKYAKVAKKLLDRWMADISDSEFSFRIESAQKKIDELQTESGRRRLFAISKSEIELRKIISKADETYYDLEQRSKSPIDLIKLLPKFKTLPEIHQFQKFIQSLENRERDLIFELINKGVKAGMMSFPHLVGLSIVFYPHVASSRYPDENDVRDPLKFYTPELPLVKMFPEFVNIMKTRVMKNFFDLKSVYQKLLEISERKTT